VGAHEPSTHHAADGIAETVVEAQPHQKPQDERAAEGHRRRAQVQGGGTSTLTRDVDQVAGDRPECGRGSEGQDHQTALRPTYLTISTGSRPTKPPPLTPLSRRTRAGM